MVKTLDLKYIRYVNLFNKITRIRTKHCFEYNNALIFAVPRRFVAQAIGPNNINLERLSQIIKKRIKIAAIPEAKEDLENFISIIIRPVRFKAVEIIDNEAVITAGSQNKAALIGRNKVRLEEMKNILKQYFDVKKVRIK
jgi:NusA-like KH domain protein